MEKYFYLPENLNIKKLLEKYPNSEIEEEKLKIVCHVLSEVSLFPQSKKFKNDFVPLNSTVMQNLGIRNFPVYRDYLIRHKIIIGDNIFSEKKSRGFKYSQQFRTKYKFEKAAEYKSYKLLSKNRFSKYNSKKKFPKHLKKWFDKLEIDKSAALKELELKYEQDLKNFSKEEANLRYSKALYGINKISEKDFNFNRDNTSYRAHTNITNLNKRFRKHLMYNGEKLINCDVKNSQPYISTVLFDYKTYRDKKQLERKYNISILAKNQLCLDKPDVYLYKKWCLEGVLYDELAEVFNSELGLNLTRDEVKIEVLKTIYGSTIVRKNDYDKCKRVFKNKFPNVFRILSSFKAKSKADLAILMQSIESNIVIDRICCRMEKEYPQIPIFTIHDSIATTVGNEKVLIKIMEEEFIKVIGHLPNIKTEIWE